MAGPSPPAAQDGTVRLWDVASGQPRGEPLTGHTGAVWSVAFSPDGQTLASGGRDRTVRLWDVASGQSRGQPVTSTVSSIAFSPDGQTVASAHEEGVLVLWDVETGQPRSRAFFGHAGPIWSVAFSPDGRTFASGSEDRTVLLWDIDTRDLRDGACRRANRNLTMAEWQRYLGAEPYQKTCPDLPGPDE